MLFCKALISFISSGSTEVSRRKQLWRRTVSIWGFPKTGYWLFLFFRRQAYSRRNSKTFLAKNVTCSILLAQNFTGWQLINSKLGLIILGTSVNTNIFQIDKDLVEAFYSLLYQLFAIICINIILNSYLFLFIFIFFFSHLLLALPIMSIWQGFVLVGTIFFCTSYLLYCLLPPFNTVL